MKNILQTCTCLTSVVLVMFIPLHAIAQNGTDVAVEPVYSSAIIITELQTGAAAASDEFIELYNVSAVPVDVSGWQVRYANAGVAQTTALATLGDSQALVIPPKHYLVLHTAGVQLSVDVASQVYAAKLSSADKVVALFRPNAATCNLEVQDAVAWGASGGGEGPALQALTTGDRLVQRYRNAQGGYIDTNNNASDFELKTVSRDAAVLGVAAGATPGGDNALAAMPAQNSGAASSLAAIPIAGCTVIDPALPDNEPGQDTPQPDPALPDDPGPDGDNADLPTPEPMPRVANSELQQPSISELLPNPASPLSDAADEFIELYNPNDVPYDLTGFVLVAGSRQYAFTAETILAPQAYQAFFSAQTHLSLSNTSGQVRLIDPQGTLVSQSDAYADAKDNFAWAYMAQAWQWTTTPTPNAPNLVTAPMPKVKTVKAAAATQNKTTAKSTATQKTPKAASTKVTTDAKPVAANVVVRNPLHPGVLALVGSFALLYGAYEYRSDVANRIHQFRSYRAARREARQSAAGRRGD
ncbi:MAG TPA: lamin tail domain-containing protein [Candidatus Saccharimonadales bacterium]